MKFPEVAHREEARQELRVKMPLGKINSSSAVFSVPWQVLRTQTMYFYNCSLLKSMRAENRRAYVPLRDLTSLPCQKVWERTGDLT